jgi:hypothetical protein
MRDSILTAENVGSIDHSRRIRVGEMQSMVFKIGNNPPVDSPNAPLYDTVDGTKDKDYDANKLRAILMNKGLESTGKMTASKERCANPNLPLKRKVPNMKQGYTGDETRAPNKSHLNEDSSMPLVNWMAWRYCGKAT